MTVALASIRHLSVVADERGVDETTRKLHGLAAAQDGVAVASIREEKATISVDRALDRLRRSTDVAYRNTLQLEAGQKVLNRALDTGSIDVIEYGRQLDLLAAKYRNADRAQAGLATGAGRMRGLGGALGAGFIGGSIAGYLDPISIAHGVRSAVSSLDDLGDAAERAAVSGATLQVFRYQLQQGAGEADDADRGLERFRRTIGELALTGKGPGAEAMRALGISIRDVNGQVKSQEDLLEEVARRFPRVRDEATALAIATRLFGKEAGGALAVELAKGSDALDRTRGKLSELGVLMSEDALRAADKFDKRFNDLSMQFAASWQRIVITALEGLDQIERVKVGLSEGLDLAGSRQGRLGRGPLFTPEPMRRQANVDVLRLQHDQREYERRQIDLIAGPAIDQGRFGGDMEMEEARREAKERLAAARKADRAEAEAGIKTAGRERDAAGELNAELDFEISLLGKSAIEQRVAIELRRAGAEATSVEGQKLAEKIRYLEEEAERTARLAERMDGLRDASANIFSNVRSGFESGASGAEILLSSVERLRSRLLDIAQEHLFDAAFGASGTTDGGWLTRFLRLFGGGGVLPGGKPLGQGGIGHSFAPGGYSGEGGIIRVEKWQS